MTCLKLDYGSGSQPKEGYLSSDFCGSPNYDYFIEDYKVVGANDCSFDIINCRNVIHHIPEIDLHILFNEFQRLLKPNGCLIISEPRKEFHLENKLLDIIWYRFLTYNPLIMIPDEYINYKEYLINFSVESIEEHYNNEILVCRKLTA
ncbi:methyltransferase domain-containing protein [Bacillus sp. Marseille-P3800]|uniref:methyltransferase domain-containing protein n=1 Tax=Bacillus sp. Marseille-P3800 TaxID=2014782 RepID=UPI000C08A25C|nr:class I SAM-dependent methyltransferase [Bacillus sp. Marseille-P3800]